MPAARRCTGEVTDRDTVDQAISMLIEALRILDEKKSPPEIGARLQGVIDDLREYHATN
jgi:hypothetical protein